MSESVGVDPGRLNGWKEIAGHLARGPRTVQRWEKLYGLPVHRLGREGGEIVYAFRDEIDGWMASSARERATDEDGAEPSPAVAPPAGDGTPAPTSFARWVVPVLLAALAAAAVGTAVWRRGGGSGAPRGEADPRRQPSGWRLVNESLTVFDPGGALLFEHRFGFPLQGDLSSESWRDQDAVQPPVVIADLEGDGRSEVLVRTTAKVRSERRLFCFEADGRTRWVHQPTGTRRFGEDVYDEPWLAYRIFLTPGPAAGKRVWAVFTHGLLFPTVLRELDPADGAVRREYWSNGYVDLVAEGSWAGRPVLFVGGTNNDFREASLAVFAADRVAGSTPALRPAYACRDCAPGGPEALFLFPTLCAARWLGRQAAVVDAWVERGERVRVRVIQVGPPTSASSYYTLGPDGALVGAEISREFQAQHAQLERQGLLDHAFGAADDRDMLPVRRWDGRRFVALSGVPIAR